MNGYLIPANAKKGTLIFNIFRPFDLMLFVGGIFATLIALALVPSQNVVAVVIAVMPVSICGMLVFPIPNYHNVLCTLISIYKFYTGRRKYVWKGWCFREQFAREEAADVRAKKSATNK